VTAAVLVIVVLGYAPFRSQAMIAGKLVQVTGPVELRSSDAEDWRAVDRLVNVPYGTHVRTGSRVLCEIETTDRSRIRVNEQAELIVHDPRRLELREGKIWCASGDGAEVKVDIPLRENGDDRVWTMACPSSSEFEWSADGNAATCVAGDGSRGVWSCGPQAVDVAPGCAVSVDTQSVVNQGTDVDPSSKIWQLPLLAARQRELQDVLRPLLATIGMSKARFLTEDQIRQLGPPGAIALLVFVESSSETDETELRHTAMRIAIETCDATARRHIESLQADADPVIAQLAANWLASN
jgi:hypothetical protein